MPSTNMGLNSEYQLDNEEKWSKISDPTLIEAVYIVDAEAESRLVRRIDVRLLPASMLIYLICFLDRSNIGNAKILNKTAGASLQQTIRTSDNQFNIALMIFLIAYILFEVPSNYLLKKFRPNRWLALLMLCWGAVTMGMSGVHNYASLVGLRFLLGIFEAGLFPGIVYCLSFWYKPEERAVRIAFILACATLAGAFGGAIAFGVGHMEGLHGLHAWSYLFIIEGALPVGGALLCLLFFPNFPETEKWLSEDERKLAVERIKGYAALGHDHITAADALEALTDWRLYLHYLAALAYSVPFSSISLFAPTIISGLGYDGLNAQLFTVPPYAIATIITITVSWISDRYEARSWGALICLFIAGISFLVQGALPPESFHARYGMLCIAASFSFACIPALLSWLMANLKGTGALTLIVPLNVSIGSTGQIIGVYIYKEDDAPGYRTGHYTNAAVLLMGSIIVLALRYIYIVRNRSIAPEGRKWRL